MVLAVLFQISCGNEAAKNRNANIAENYNKSLNKNTNQKNTNTNTEANTQSNETSADEEVPKFEDADEALAKGNEYYDADETEKAIDAFKQAIELNPDLAEAHFKIGNNVFSDGRQRKMPNRRRLKKHQL